jgi:hypothetical protein
MSIEPVAAAKAEIVGIARSVLCGAMSPIAGARAIVRLRFNIGEFENDADLLLMTGIESETDHLPIGPERDHWDPEVLATRASEISDAQHWAQKTGRAALESIVRRWGGEATNGHGTT